MLVNEFPPLPVGGAERQAERLSQFLAAQGWNIRVLTRGTIELPRHQQKDGYQITRVVPVGPGKLKSLTFVVGAVRELWQRRHEYQILHAHLAFGPAFAAALVGRLLGKSVIVKFGNSGPFGDIQTSQKTLRGRFRISMLRRWANAVITLDPTMQAEALAAGFSSTQIRRMPNGIDLRPFQNRPTKLAARQSLGLKPGLTLIYTGRLSKQKSLETLVKAFSQASQEISDLQLLIVGDGPERKNLEKLTGDLSLQDHVHFAGNQSDVVPYLTAADIFVLPSLSEGISNSLLEAMTCGLACIATAVGGTAEVIRQAGVLVEPGQSEQLANEIMRLANNPLDIARLGRLAQQRILDEYALDIVGRRYIQLYQELLSPQPDPIKNEAAV